VGLWNIRICFLFLALFGGVIFVELALAEATAVLSSFGFWNLTPLNQFYLMICRSFAWGQESINLGATL
jgi:hypothetical protein